ncbi:MAG: hypothetical protein IJ301_03360 [Clostridia bacterium]|nr:hypothetical protein [Clostridia bacterium]
MTKKSFSLKTLLLTIVLVMSFLFMQNSMFFASWINQNTKSSLDATSDLTSQQDVTSSIGLVNPNFSEYDGTSSYPRTPDGWTVWSTESRTPHKAGLIDLNGDIYKLQYKNYGLENFTQPATQGSGSEQSVLMINANNEYRNYGYQTETDISLVANSFYSISLYVYTDSASTASVYLTGTDFDELESAKITNINTYSRWQQVVFYIATGANTSSTMGMQLLLGEKSSVSGSKGFVLFDNIKITRYAGSNFETVVNTGANSTFVDLRPNFISNGYGYIANSDFSNGLTDWTFDSTVKLIQDFSIQQNINDKSVIIGDNQHGDTTGILLTADNSYSAITSSDIQVERQGFYRITFWAKGEITSGNVNFVIESEKLDPDLPDEEKETKYTQTISTLATDGSTFDNKWSLYAFYIVGNPLFDANNVKLTLGLGTESASATGYVAIAGIRSEKVTSAKQASAISNNANSATLNLHNNASMTFANGAFNYVQIEDVNTTSPLAPLNWTKQNKNANGSGVVNIKASNWTQNIDRPTNEGDYSNNVLMIRNDFISATTKYQGYTSESVTLDKDGYAEISVKAFTRSISEGGNAFITLKNADDVIIKQIKLKSTNAWQTYKIYLHNYFVSQTLTLSLSLGDENTSTTGVAFFDDCLIDTSITADDFSAVTASNTTFVLDLTENSLTANENGIPAFWTATNAGETNDVSGGITHISSFPAGNPTAPTEEISDVMYISANAPAYYYYANDLKYTFSSGTYYKISVLVRTVDITENVEGEYDASGNQIIHGAFISVDGVDSSFKGINTATTDTSAMTLAEKFEDITNVWKEYIIYLNPTSEINGVIKLGIGQSTMLTGGYAFFADLNVSSMTEDEYKSETTTLDAENLPENILLASTIEDEDEESSNNSYNQLDWFAIPTVIIAVAVIVAVLGFFIQRVYRSRPQKTTQVTNEYDRLQTLLKDVDRRERKTAIKHKIALLHEELTQSQEFLKQEMEELEKQTSAYNTAKEIAQDNPDVQLEVPDVTQIEESIQIQQEKIEQIEYDIRVLEDERERINNQIRKEQKRANKNIKNRK